MARILILIGAHLASAPRPQKEAMALLAAGHDVEILGVWSSQAWVERDALLMQEGIWHFQPALDFRPQGWRGMVKNIGVRLQSRWARELFRRRGRVTPALLGYGVHHLLRAALARRADLTIVHAEGGLWVGEQLRQAGLRVGVDFEDWFSEDLTAAMRQSRPLTFLRRLEQDALRNCRYALTTSHALAASLAERYETPAPQVVYNVFPWADRETLDTLALDRPPGRQRVSLHWFSQTLGPGRGLEFLFAALPHMRIPVEIHLRAQDSPGSREWLARQLSPVWRERVFVHPLVPNRDLLSRIAEHDVGLSLDDTVIPSRDLTVTNKLFQYLLAGLFIVATDTRGQREILGDHPEAGILVPSGDARHLAAALDELAGNPLRLAAGRKAALELAKSRYCWELQAPVVVEAVERALQ
ncbi:MAG: glycosyltransferase [Magnetococcus sp. DMHC-1]